MSIVDRVKHTMLPLDQLVVIGAGVLDALKLRDTYDIDMVVTPELFEKLRRSGEYAESAAHGEIVLTKNDQEIWLSWGNSGKPNFHELFSSGITIDGVRFCHPVFVLEWKRTNQRSKDHGDIVLLENYLETKGNFK